MSSQFSPVLILDEIELFHELRLSNSFRIFLDIFFSDKRSVDCSR